MTSGKNHAIAGILVGCTIFIVYTILLKQKLSSFEVMVLAGISLIYPLLADVDHKISRITWYLLGVADIMIIIGYAGPYIHEYVWMPNILLIGVILLNVTIISAVFLSHRGPTHTIQAAVLSSLLLYPLLRFDYMGLYLAAIIMYESHLILDGIPLKTSTKGQIVTR